MASHALWMPNNLQYPGLMFQKKKKGSTWQSRTLSLYTCTLGSVFNIRDYGPILKHPIHLDKCLKTQFKVIASVCLLSQMLSVGFGPSCNDPVTMNY